MRIQIVSDIHLEFGSISIFNNNADVLVLSGDICVVKDFNDNKMREVLLEFFKECSERFPKVIYVMGNHEHYAGDVNSSLNTLKNTLKEFSNIHILEQETIVINDVTFIVGTLWTDMNNQDPSTLFHIKRVMNDYRVIEDSSEMVSFKFTDKDGNKKFGNRPSIFSPEKSVLKHNDMLEFIKQQVSISTGKVVIVSHHAPSKLSTKPMYERDFLVNGAYSSDLSKIMLDNPQIKLWTHGHTHDSFDYTIGSTRVVCNPRGYFQYSENQKFDCNFTVEV